MAGNTILKPFLFSDNEVNCSSEEQNTGLKWIDGKYIFDGALHEVNAKYVKAWEKRHPHIIQLHEEEERNNKKQNRKKRR